MGVRAVIVDGTVRDADRLEAMRCLLCSARALTAE
jgi:regulator of RNase E activity RraA